MIGHARAFLLNHENANLNQPARSATEGLRVRQSPERKRRVFANPALDFDELSRVALGALKNNAGD
jgi:hypothetical protein